MSANHVNRSLVAAVLAVRQGAIPADRAADLLAHAFSEGDALSRVESVLVSPGYKGPTVIVSPSLVEAVAEKLEKSDDLSDMGLDETTVRTLSQIRNLSRDDPGLRDTLLSISPTRMVQDLDYEEMDVIDAADHDTGSPTAAPRQDPKRKKPSSQLLRAVARAERYTVEKEHARGGMGRILIARDNIIGRDVALKELLPQRRGGGSIPQETEGSRGLTERFLREAKVTGQLEHPNIVSVYEIGKNDDDSLYYTMKFVRGKTLMARLNEIARDDTLDKKEKLQARLKLLDNFVAVCNAIAYAHSKGVIHRDLKPENVMLGDFGETIVLDWGLARVRGQEDTVAQKLIDSTRYMSQSVVARESDQLTLDGSIVGTPAYMSPEQARGELDEIDEKSDVYALGAVLYQILCGRPPYDAPAAGLIIQQVLHGKPLRMSAISPEIPPELEALVEKAMAKEKPARLSSALEFASEVKAFRDGRTITSYSYSARELAGRWFTRHKRTVVIIMLALYALIAGAVYHYAQLQEEKRALNDEKAYADTQRRLAENSLDDANRANADALKAREEAEEQARVAKAEAIQTQKALQGWDQTLADAYAMRIRLAMQQNDQNAALAFAAASLQSADQAEARGTLLSAPHVTPLLWNLKTDAPLGHEIFQFFSVGFSPDGRMVASGMPDGRIWIWSTETGNRIQTLGINGNAAHGLAFSPEGRWLAAGTDNGFIRFWEIEGEIFTPRGDARTHNGTRLNSLLFSPDGRTLFAGGADLTAYDVATRAELGVFEAVKNHQPMFLSISPDGERLYSTSVAFEDLFVREYDVATRTFTRALLDHSSFNEFFTAWAPDGSVMASATLQGRIILRDTKLRRIGSLDAHTSSVLGIVFSPDGKRLLSSSADGTVRCWNISTQTEEFSLSGFVDWVESVAFSPDGLSFCTRGRSGGVQVWAMPAADTQALTEHNSDVADVRFSPDGSQFVSAGWDGSVILWDFAGRKPLRTFTLPLTQFFAAEFLDAGRIVVGSSNGVFVFDTKTGDQLAHVAKGEYVSDFALTGDRKFLAHAQYRQCVMRDITTLAEVFSTSRHNQNSTCVAISPDDKLVATASFDGGIIVTDVATRQALYRLGPVEGPVASLLFDADGTHLLAACFDRMIRVWDLATKQVSDTLRGHEGFVFSLRFDPARKLLFSSSQDHTVRVWSALDYSPIAVLRGHTEIVTRMNVSPDGQTLLSAGQDDTIRVWRLEQLSISRYDFVRQAYATTGLVIRDKDFAVQLDPDWPKGAADNRSLLAARMARGNETRRYARDFDGRFEGYRCDDVDGARRYYPPRKRLPGGLLEGPVQGQVNFAAWWADQHPEWTPGYEQAPVVSEVLEEGQGPEHGLQVGDVIWTVDGARVTNREDLRAKLETLADRENFTVVVRRYARENDGKMKPRSKPNGDVLLNTAGESDWDMQVIEYTFTPGKLGLRIGEQGIMARPYR